MTASKTTESKTQTFLFSLLGLGRGGSILYLLLFVLAVPALTVWTVFLPRWRFTDADEALFRAARHGDVPAIEQSLAAGANVNRPSPVDGKTALFRAAILGHADAVRFLITHGAEAAAVGSDGHTPIEIVGAARSDERDADKTRALDAVTSLLENAESLR